MKTLGAILALLAVLATTAGCPENQGGSDSSGSCSSGDCNEGKKPVGLLVKTNSPSVHVKVELIGDGWAPATGYTGDFTSPHGRFNWYPTKTATIVVTATISYNWARDGELVPHYTVTCQIFRGTSIEEADNKANELSFDLSPGSPTPDNPTSATCKKPLTGT